MRRPIQLEVESRLTGFDESTGHMIIEAHILVDGHRAGSWAKTMVDRCYMGPDMEFPIEETARRASHAFAEAMIERRPV